MLWCFRGSACCLAGCAENGVIRKSEKHTSRDTLSETLAKCKIMTQCVRSAGCAAERPCINSLRESARQPC